MLSPVLFLWRFFPCFAPRFAATPIATVSLELNGPDFIEMLCTFPIVDVKYIQIRWSYGSKQLAVAGRSLDMVEPNPIHGLLLVLV
jgi:hypothetical protein